MEGHRPPTIEAVMAALDALTRRLDAMTQQPSADGGLPPVLSVVEAAKHLRVDRNTLYEMIKRGEGPPVRHVGTKIVIDREAFLAWLREGDASRRRTR